MARTRRPFIYQQLPLVQRRPMIVTYDERSLERASNRAGLARRAGGPLPGERSAGASWASAGSASALTVTIAEEAQLRALQTVDLRACACRQITARAAVKLRRELAAEVEAAAGRRSGRAHGPSIARRPERSPCRRGAAAAQPRERAATGLRSELQRVSRIYAEAYRDHRPPTRAVAEALASQLLGGGQARGPDAAWPAFWGRPSGQGRPRGGAHGAWRCR